MTKNELECRATGREINDWMAYYHLEPFGEERNDYRSALQVFAIGKMLNGEKVSMFDMMPYTPKPVQTWQQMQAFCKGMAKSMAKKEKVNV